MAYPTWLVFFDNKTTFSDFFFKVYVPFDCEFMVARSIDTGREIINEVYQIDKEKELRSMRFGVWDVKIGLKGPKHGLFSRRNDLFGQKIRVTSVHVRSHPNRAYVSYKTIYCKHFLNNSRSDDFEKYLLNIQQFYIYRILLLACFIEINKTK